MKKNIILFLSLTIIFLSCQRNDKIIGVWEREGDAFAGMKVEVIRSGNNLNGIIIYSPEYSKTRGFVENDIKWKDIKNIEVDSYEFKSLQKTTDNYGNIINVDYVLTRLEIKNNIIKTRLYSKGSENIGTEQIWIRVK